MNLLNLLKLTAVALVIAGNTGCTHSQRKKTELATKLSYDNADNAGAANYLELTLNRSKEETNVNLLMDLCAYWHYAGDYARSNEACQKASVEADMLYTKSIREQAASFIVGDKAISFQGAEHERIFLHIIGMLNYAALDDLPNALVQARKFDNKLNYFSSNPEAIQSQFKGDALGRYISGLLYEQNRENNDAYIDFKKSIKTYSVNPGINIPNLLPYDAARTARNHGMLKESKDTQKRFGLTKKDSPLSKQSGEVIIVFENGFGNYKYENDGLPVQQTRSSTVNAARVKSLQTGQVSQSEHVKNLSLIANVRHEEMLPEIRRRVEARRAAGAVLSFGAGMLSLAAGGVNAAAVVGVATNAILSILTDADLRSWETLPAQVDLARLALVPGKHDLAIKLYGHYGTELYRGVLNEVVVQAGKRTWIIQKLP